MYCYKYITEHKQKFLRPDGIVIVERSAMCPLQSMFEHTARRIFDIPENKNLIDQVRHFKELNGGSLTITFYAGIGPDGSTGERSE